MIPHPYYNDVYANPTEHVDVGSLQRDASCTQMPYGLFYFPDEEEAMGRAMWFDRKEDGFGTEEVYDFLRGFCAGCPVLEKCFTHSVFYEEYGFWAGTSPADRKEMRDMHDITLRGMNDSDRLDAEILAARKRQAKEVGFCWDCDRMESFSPTEDNLWACDMCAALLRS